VSLAARWMPRFGTKYALFAFFSLSRRMGRRDGGAPSEKYAALAETAALPGQKVCSIACNAAGVCVIPQPSRRL